MSGGGEGGEIHIEKGIQRERTQGHVRFNEPCVGNSGLLSGLALAVQLPALYVLIRAKFFLSFWLTEPCAVLLRARCWTTDGQRYDTQ